jgi:hypothetical protein
MCLHALVLGALLVQGAAAGALTQDRPVRNYQGTLSQARLSQMPDGHTVVSFDVAGDLRGVLTLNLTGGDGSGLSGTWAMKVAYLQDLNPDGSPASVPQPEPGPDEDHALHREYVKLMNDGSLQGTVSGVAIRLDDAANVIGVDGLVVVTAGSVKYAGAQGTGSFSMSGTTPAVCAYSLVF